MIEFFEFRFDFFNPTFENFDFLFDFCKQSICGFYQSVLIALIGFYAFAFHLTDCNSFVNSRYFINTLSFITAIINSFCKLFFFKLFVAHSCPFRTPMFKSFGFTPVGCRYSRENIIAVMVGCSFSVSVKLINTFLFVTPFAVFINRSYRAHNMNVGICNAVCFGRMNCKVGNHSSFNKLFQYEFLCERNIFFHRKFILQCKIETVCKLSFFAFFDFLDCVPQSFSVCKILRNIFR